MNCQTFETHVNELARERMMEAATREAASVHANSCRRCAARLADERALTDGLRALSSVSARSTEAPHRVETALIAAFRAQHQQPTTVNVASQISQPTDAGSNGSSPVPFAPRRARRNRLAYAWVQGTAVAAAAMLIVFGFSAMRGRPARPEVDRQQTAAVLSPRSVPPAAPSNVAALPPAGEVAQSMEAADATADASPIETGAEEVSKRSDLTPRVAQARTVRYSNAGYRSGGAASSNNARATEAVAEITTDYIPLTHGGALAPEEGGQVLRVELPRSALVSFGLPMNVERAGERVKADVLMGEDGVARAIRFVR